MLEKRILLLGFVREISMYLGTLAWLLESVGSVSANTKVAVLQLCHLVTDLRALQHMVFSL